MNIATDAASASEPAKDTSSATWKFKFEDTVNADPRAKGCCLKVIRVMLNFASKSDPTAFCSLPDLMLLTASTRPTVKKALKILIQLGYLDPQYVTEGGSMMYRVVNARQQIIDDHLRIAKQSLAFERADRKKRDRKAHRGKETCPPQIDEGERILPPKVKESFPNTVELYRRDSCSESSNGSLEEHSTFIPDLTTPFDVPSSEEEVDDILACVGEVHPTILKTLRKMLMAGQLTPALLTADLGGHHDRSA
jgi:hypothetical protein